METLIIDRVCGVAVGALFVWFVWSQFICHWRDIKADFNIWRADRKRRKETAQQNRKGLHK